MGLLATLRRDGSPRISPVEPYLFEGHLLFGSMSYTPKTRDLLRDPRCVLHSAVTGPDNEEGELKLYGRAVVAETDLRAGCTAGWWHAHAPEAAAVFVLEVDEAAYVGWDTAAGEMTVRRWSPGRGCSETRRSYP